MTAPDRLTAKHVAPPEFGDVRQFLIERRPDGSPIPQESVLLWVHREPEARTNWTGKCGCQWIYRVTEDSRTWVKHATFPRVKEKPSVTNCLDSAAFVCTCMGRFIE